MKKIAISLGIIGVVAAIVIGATTAYFSDTETSTGNTFTAGILDLKVDIDGGDLMDLSGPIFEEGDMKPGDKGEVTLSLHVDNDACGFVSFVLNEDKENTCTEPESEVETGCDPLGPGELNENVMWKIWNDEGDTAGWQGQADDPKEGNNILDGQVEAVLVEGPLTDGVRYAFGELLASNVLYYGFAWELPAAVGNEVQSDSFTADMVIKAEQKRNQYDDQCPFGELEPEPPLF